MSDRTDPSTGTELSPLERAIDTVLFAPYDLGWRALEQLPGVAGRVREQLVFARFIGRLAVQQGNVEIRRRLDCRTDPSPADARAGTEPRSASLRSTGDVDPADESAIDGGPPVGVTAEDLALPDYDQLPAAHIIEKLAGLTPAERALVEAYETTHRGRRTVLGKLERLREA